MGWSQKKSKKKKALKRKYVKKRLGAWLFCLLMIVCLSHYLPRAHFFDAHFNAKTLTSQEEAFINEIGNYAVMNYKTSKVLPSVVVAQAILESDFGRSQLASQYHNLFGKKASGKEPQVRLVTKEYTKQGWIEVSDAFVVYPNWKSSVEDHGNLIKNGTSWNANLYQKVRESKNYRNATQALGTAGYATDPNYHNKLNRLIEEYRLYRFDYQK